MAAIPRRRIAPLIRARQELEKRVDSVAPWALREKSIEQLLTRDAAREFAHEAGKTPDALRHWLATASSRRFPRAQLLARPVGELPARDALDAEIQDILRGEWAVFGASITVRPSDHDWARHPLTGVAPKRTHWSRVPYMNGIGSGGDVKVIWELSRHHQLVRLAQAHFLDRSSGADAVVVQLLDRWIAQNPPGQGINWTSSLEIAFRAISWCWIWALTCDSPAWTDAHVRRFVHSLWHHARHVERFDSIHHSPNTHLTGEGLGLLYVGLLFPELARSRRWARRGREILESELPIQVFGDGMHFERATGYHRYTVEFYLHYLLLADAFTLTVPAETRTRIRAQVRAAALLRRPDGTWPVIGDEDGGDTLLLAPNAAQDQGPILAVGGALFEESSLVALTNPVHRAAGWWLLDDTAWRWLCTQPVEQAAHTSSLAGGAAGALPVAGYFIGRDGQGADDWWCLVDAGPHGGDQTGHAHTDLGHVEIAHGSSHLVVDPGCPDYTVNRARRDAARSESVHACVVTDGIPLAMPAGPFSWASIAPTPAVRSGNSDACWWCELAYSRGSADAPITHRRLVVLVRGQGLVVHDVVESHPPLRFAVHWPIGPVVAQSELADGILTVNGHAISWSAAGKAKVAASLQTVTRSPGYGRECDASLLILGYEGGSAGSMVTCVSDARRPLAVVAHDDTSLQIVTMGDSGDASTLVIIPGQPPVLRRQTDSVPSPQLVR